MLYLTYGKHMALFFLSAMDKLHRTSLIFRRNIFAERASNEAFLIHAHQVKKWVNPNE